MPERAARFDASGGLGGSPGSPEEPLTSTADPQPADEESRPAPKKRRRRGARPGEPDLLCYPYIDSS